MIWSRLPLLMATPHLDPLPFTKGRGGRSPVDPKLTINEHYRRFPERSRKQLVIRNFVQRFTDRSDELARSHDALAVLSLQYRSEKGLHRATAPTLHDKRLAMLQTRWVARESSARA